VNRMHRTLVVVGLIALVASLPESGEATRLDQSRAQGTRLIVNDAYRVNAITSQVLAVRAGTSRVLTRRQGFSYAPLLPSPDGRHILFDREPCCSGVGTYRALWAFNRNGTNQHQVVVIPPSRCGNALGVGSIAWSPSGRRLAYAIFFASDARHGCLPGVRDVVGAWVTSYDHPQPRQLTYGGDPQGGAPLSWSPDERTLATNRSGNVVAVDVTTGRSRVLVYGGRQGVFAPVTGDLAYVTGGERRGHSTLIWVAGTQGRRRHLLASTRIPVVEERALLWSPDGRSISYITGNGADVHPGLNTSGTRTLWVAGGGRLHPRRLVTDPAGSLFSPAWSPDSRGLAFIAAGACGSALECPNSTYLASVDIATGMRERIQYSGHQGASVLPHSQLTSVVWLAS